MCVWICYNSRTECIEDQGIVITVPDLESHDAPIIQIKDSTEIHLVDDWPFIPLEFRNVCQPFFVRPVCLEIPIQFVLGNILRICSMPSTTVVGILDGGFDPFRPADSEHALVADLYLMVFLKIISYTPVSFVRIVVMNLFSKLRNSFVLLLPKAFLATYPFIICRPGNPQLLATLVNRISILCNTGSNSCIFMGKLYLRKAFLLSNSSNFFSRSRSIFVIYSSCSSCAILIFISSSAVRGS